MGASVPLPIKGKFEIEHEGHKSYLAYETDGREWISLLQTWVAPELRKQGVANELSKKALDYAREQNLKVEVICPIVFHYIHEHPEYRSLVAIRS